MNSALWLILSRYTRASNRQTLIHWMSGLAWLSIALGTMAMLVVFSVFNGLENLLRLQFNRFNPDIKVVPRTGKTFTYHDSLGQYIQSLPGVVAVSEVIEDDAVVHYGSAQMVIRLKGVSDNYHLVSHYASHMLAGSFERGTPQHPKAAIGYGVYRTLSYSWGDIRPIEIWYPNRKGKITFSEQDLKRALIQVGGIFEVEFEQDARYVIAPLYFVQQLMQYESERTALEISVEDRSVPAVKQALEKRLGEHFQVMNREEQQSDLLRAIRIEKLFALLTLSVLLFITTLNIFYTLSMLVLDKQKDISILKSLGASKQLIGSIFLLQGMLIGITGSLAGLLAGALLVAAQERWGFIKMGVQSSIVDAYPVALRWSDVGIILLLMCFISLLTTYLPAYRAGRTFVRTTL